MREIQDSDERRAERDCPCHMDCHMLKDSFVDRYAFVLMGNVSGGWKNMQHKC